MLQYNIGFNQTDYISMNAFYLLSYQYANYQFVLKIKKYFIKLLLLACPNSDTVAVGTHMYSDK